MTCDLKRVTDCTRSELDDYCRCSPVWLSNPVHMRYSRHRRVPHDWRSQEAYIRFYAMIAKAGGSRTLWLVFKKPLVIGSVATEVNEEGVADLGVLTDPDYCTKIVPLQHGVATEALRYVIAQTPARLFTIGCAEPHLAMRRVAEKLGMRLDAILPGRIMLDDGPAGQCCYSMEALK